MKSILLACFVLGLVAWVEADSCDEPMDDNVYSFAYGTDYLPYMDLNKDGELYGFNYNLVRSICKVMSKNCVHLLMYDYSQCWDDSNHSPALYNRWWDVCVGYAQTRERISAMGFVSEFANELTSYIYVKKGSDVDTLDELRDSEAELGFLEGWALNPDCLERRLSLYLGSRARTDFRTYDELSEAVSSGEVAGMLVNEQTVGTDERFERVNTDDVRCSEHGFSMMMRKDLTHKYSWMDEGLQKIRENGDYDWLCNLAEADGDPNCLE